MNIEKNNCGTYSHCCIAILDDLGRFVDGFKPFIKQRDERWMRFWGPTNGFSLDEKIDLLSGMHFHRDGEFCSMTPIITERLSLSLRRRKHQELSAALDAVNEVCIMINGGHIMIKNVAHFSTSSGGGEYVSIPNMNAIESDSNEVYLKNKKSVIWTGNTMPPEFRENTVECGRSEAVVILSVQNIGRYRRMTNHNPAMKKLQIWGVLTLIIGPHVCEYPLSERAFYDAMRKVFGCGAGEDCAELCFKFTDDFLFGGGGIHTQIMNAYNEMIAKSRREAMENAENIDNTE